MWVRARVEPSPTAPPPRALRHLRSVHTSSHSTGSRAPPPIPAPPGSDLQVPVRSSTRQVLLIPRAAVLPRPLQHLQVPAISSCGFDLRNMALPFHWSWRGDPYRTLGRLHKENVFLFGTVHLLSGQGGRIQYNRSEYQGLTLVTFSAQLSTSVE